MQLMKEKQDLTYLSWSVYRNSSGTAGSFLKAYSELGGKNVDFAATSPTARGKKSTFTGKEAHSHGHEVHREQRGFCPSAP